MKTRMNITAEQSIKLDYNVLDLPIYMNKEELEDFPYKKTVPHWNEGLETILIKKGRMNLVINGESTVLEERDICIINPGCVHYFDSINEQNCQYYCGIIEESFLKVSKDITRKYVNPIFHSLHPGIEIIKSGTTEYEEFLKLFTKINDLLFCKPPAYDMEVVAQFYSFISLIFRHLENSPLVSSSAASKVESSMRKMISYIQANYSNSISIDDLCKVGLTSRNQVFTMFRKYTGDSPANFILEYRLSMSKDLLANTKLPISHIATMCGFTHQSHYTNHFKKHYGITPLMYRKIH